MSSLKDKVVLISGIGGGQGREAALRLKASADDVLEIAFAAGFRDLSNFNHAFRAEFGVSPRFYRLQTRGSA